MGKVGETDPADVFFWNVHLPPPPDFAGFIFDPISLAHMFLFKWIGEKPPPRLISIGDLLGKYPSPMDPMDNIISYAWQFCW